MDERLDTCRVCECQGRRVVSASSAVHLIKLWCVHAPVTPSVVPQEASATFTFIFRISEMEEKNGKEKRQKWERKCVCVRERSGERWADGLRHDQSAHILTYFHHSDYIKQCFKVRKLSWCRAQRDDVLLWKNDSVHLQLLRSFSVALRCDRNRAFICI